ncbi:MAG: hypothetical protein FJ243_00895 [Nitrospira sp.]|nr:hypothetical protein [Nitrospira sp.]
MSYILDALKKSERERKRGSVPEVLTIQDVMTPQPRKRSRWLYLLVVALLLNAALLTVWVISSQSKKTKVIAQSQTVPKVEQKTAVSPALSQMVDHASKGAEELKERAGPQQSAQAKAQVQKKSSEKSVPPPTLPSPENRIYNLDELPLSLQKSLPGFVISFSVHSDDPDSRIAKINGKVLREGDYLNTGLKVEEIARDCIIFSLQNYRFLVELK